MLTRRATAAGGVAGMLVGVGTAAVLSTLGYLYLWTAFWSFVAASVTLLVVSAVTTRPSPTTSCAASSAGCGDVD